MSEIERIIRSFSPAERELWAALGGMFPPCQPRDMDWAVVKPRSIRGCDRAAIGGDPNRRCYPELERYVAAKLAAKSKKRKAA